MSDQSDTLSDLSALRPGESAEAWDKRMADIYGYGATEHSAGFRCCCPQCISETGSARTLTAAERRRQFSTIDGGQT
jgi:hypothetical protein